ncbi:MAG: sulfotransferase [Salinisphaeraceae bacterium]|nr:sulfotransferase [Salinisphaeraceae bacterium]
MSQRIPFKPYRPLAIRLFNAVGRVLAVFGIKASLKPESIIKAARRRAGLQEFGNTDFMPALEVLANALDTEAKLHPFGRLVARDRLVGFLTVRLKVQQLTRDHPEILQQQIKAPLVIAGLQRTGTTMLHRLLAADPDNRAMMSWESIDPTPPAVKPGKPDPRYKKAQLAEKALKYMAPEFFAIHPVEAGAPEEDILLLEYSLMSDVPESMFYVPSYGEWLKQQDMTPAYDYLKLLLQLLQWQDAPKNERGRWVLKTPAHLGQLDTLLKVFPDARIIQTHRDPSRTTASFSSMVTHGTGVFSDQVDAHERAMLWLNKNADMLRSARRVREQQPEAFIDVSYYDLMQDPLGEVQRIYAFAGIELTAASRTAMEASRKANKKDRHGKHRYSLEAFGLTPEIVDEKYADYRKTYGIPPENTSTVDHNKVAA